MKHAARFLATAITYDVPSQDMTIDFSKMLARPKSGFVMANICGAQ